MRPQLLLHALLACLFVSLVGCPSRGRSNDDDDASDDDDSVSGDDDDATGDDDDTAADDDDTAPDDDDTAVDDDDTAPDDDDTAADDDDSWDGTFCNPWDPIEAAGSSKTFNTELQQVGATVETVTPLGVGTFMSQSLWQIATTLVASDGTTGTGNYWLDCNDATGDVFAVGWDLSEPSQGLSGTAQYAPARKILSGNTAVGTTWTISQTESVTVMGTPVTLNLSMIYEIDRTETVTVPAGTFDAIVVVADYTIVDPSGQILQGTFHGVEETYFVEGLGVVLIDHQREDSAGSGSMVLFEYKELTSYSGLTAQ
jgi:hypothetical protein